MPKLTARNSVLNGVKAHFRSTIGKNRLHTVMLVYVHNNVLDNINLAYVANQFVDRKDRLKQTLRHLSQNCFSEL